MLIKQKTQTAGWIASQGFSSNSLSFKILLTKKPNIMSKKVADIEGIGPAYAEKLATAGIRSVAGLLKMCCDKKGRKSVAETTGIDESKLLKWANMADLYRIKGVGSEYSELLEAAGVDTVKELRTRNAANLFEKMTEVNAAKKLVRQLPSAKQVEGFVELAKTLDPVITH